MAKAQTQPDDDMDNYKAQDDARTLTNAEEIRNDPERHGRAAAHLQKQAGNAAAAHKAARKHMEKKVRGGMKKAFPDGSANSGPAMVPKKGKTFEQTKDQETAEAEQTVNED